MILDLLFFGSGSLLLCILAYLFFLAIASLWPEKQFVSVAPKTRFALVIPAHNEAELIGDTLSSIRACDYPQELYEIIVVADNCEDDTKKIVEEHNVTCWLRTDLDNRGKGNVLKWVFPRLLEYGDHDA